MNHPSKKYNPWDEFVHSAHPSNVSSAEIVERFAAFNSLFQRLPKKELVQRGWIRSNDDIASLASIFFGQSNTSGAALFRKSPTANEALISVWLSEVRAKAELTCIDKLPPAFEGLDKQDLRSIAKLSPNPRVLEVLPAIFKEFGVILIYLNALPGMKADGAVFRLETGNPVIALSLRFSRLDYFWFTLMHELAHLSLHEVILEHKIVVFHEDNAELVIEKAANRLAKDSFVDRSSWRNCEPKYQSGDESVIRYAQQQGIHPSIVAGMLRRETGNYTKYSSIINEHDVRSLLGIYD